ncbi:MAG: hypothetical protein L6R36_003564 [Xanthoria steineri]|nr:MAG: hypothetical protein L6R36_003564 [Xanthoria steineri]
MPSKKELNRIDHEDLSLKIHTTESTSRRRNKWQNKAHLDGRIPKAVPFHAHKLKQQLDNVYRASRGQEGVPRKAVKHFCDSFDDLYDKLMPGIDGDPIAAADVHVKKAVQHHNNKRARRTKSFRNELPPPFNELDIVDPNLAIFVPMEDSGAVAVLRELEGSRALHKLREAIHEAHWWFGEDVTVGWVIALRQLPGGDLEVFADTAQHRNVLQKNSAWETVFLDNLVEESRRYGVSPRGLSVTSLPKFPNDEQRTLLIQQLYDWNKSRIGRLGALEEILSIEVRETNRGKPIVVVNLAQPEIANEFVAKGIQWGETTYVGRSSPNDEKQMTEEEKLQIQGMMTTDVINTESPSSDAAKTGKPGVASREDSDGHREQQLTEGISTAKRTEDDSTSDPSIQNIIRMLHDSSKEGELALHQQVESIKPASAKTRRRARCKRQARQKKDANKQTAKATKVADEEETETPGGEGSEAEFACTVPAAAECKSDEEVKNGEAGHKPSQASGEIDPKVFEPMKPRILKAQEDREQESIHVPPKSHIEQSAVAQKGILETPPTLPPLIRRFQSRNAVGGN